MRKDEKSYVYIVYNDIFEDTKWSNQKPEIEAQQTKKLKIPNNDLQNIIQKTKVHATRTPLKPVSA